MARKLKTDGWLFTATLLLVAVSIAWVYSASAAMNPEDPEHPLVRQLLWIALGGVGLFASMNLNYRVYAHPTVLRVLLGATVVGLVAVYFFPEVNGGHRWLGFAGLGIQPSEFAKLVVILFAADTIGRKLDANEPLNPAFARAGIVAGGTVLLILLEPDGGGAALLAGIVAAMMFVAGLPIKWVGVGAAAAPILAVVVVVIEPYRVRRAMAFLDPWSDPQGAGYQTIQSLIAVGTGGWLGQGYMSGVQKMGYLPMAHNDFIYAVIAEERGLVGASLVLLGYALIVWRGLRVARTAPDPFGALVATGIAIMIGFQALYNISVVLNLVPAKGIPLPFVSAGGSSMLVSLFAMGVLLNISQQASATDS